MAYNTKFVAAKIPCRPKEKSKLLKNQAIQKQKQDKQKFIKAW
jgi:hypothetical protein